MPALFIHLSFALGLTSGEWFWVAVHVVCAVFCPADVADPSVFFAQKRVAPPVGALAAFIAEFDWGAGGCGGVAVDQISSSRLCFTRRPTHALRRAVASQDIELPILPNSDHI